MKHSIQKSVRPESPLYGRGLGEASYFKFSELTASATAERLGIDNTPPHAARKMLTILVEQLLDPIRRRYGAPIIVTSGYRCPSLNTAVDGVANSHHIVGCAADIVAPLLSPQGGKNQAATFLSSPLGGSEGGRGVHTLSLFHLIIQMQREGAIQFTQLLAEEGYRWLHISYVPGMLRNQVIDVNDNDDADAKGASVNLQFPSFAPRHRLSKLISALGLASVATKEALVSPRSFFQETPRDASHTLSIAASTVPLLGGRRRGMKASVATTGGLSPQRRLYTK